MPITQTPIVPIQIAGNEYRLWLRSEYDRPYKHDETIQLSVHFQQLPYGLDRLKYDSEGYVTAYWYKPTEESEPMYVRVDRASLSLPKELDFSWYIAETYSIKPNDNSSEVPKNVPPKIIAVLGIATTFFLQF